MTGRLLLVTPYFPPAGGSGVQRGTKFVKYLLRLGWEIEVVTIDPATYPWSDPTMAAEVASARVEIARLASIPGVGHRVLRAIPAIRRKIKEAIRRFRPDVILATHPDFHWTLVARSAVAAGIPFVLDYPDPWTVLPPGLLAFRPPANAKSRLKWALAPAAERWCLSRAAATVFATEPILEEYSARFPRVASTGRVITNGFDPEDFEGMSASPPDPSERIRISHIGSFAGPRSPLPLARAVRRAADLKGEGRLEVSLVGALGAEARRELEETLAPIPLSITNWLPHREAIREMVSSSILWLDAMAHLRSASTGKLFEYLYSGRPVVAVAHPDSPAAALVHEFHAGRVVNAGDPETAGGALAAMIDELDGGSFVPASRDSLGAYDRRALAEELSGLLSTVVGANPARPRSVW